MPKTSAIERNKKRVLLVEKYQAKRAELKAILANPATTDAEFFAAQKKLAKLPRDSSAVRVKNRYLAEVVTGGTPDCLDVEIRDFATPHEALDAYERAEATFAEPA